MLAKKVVPAPFFCNTLSAMKCQKGSVKEEKLRIQFVVFDKQTTAFENIRLLEICVLIPEPFYEIIH